MPTYEIYIYYAGIPWNLIKKSKEASLWTYAKRTRNENRTYV